MAEAVFRTVSGVVQFDPREGKAGDKDVRNITVRTAGFKDNSMKVGATLWPSHEHVAVEKGDFVVLEGKFSRNQGTNKDGEAVTYNNMSVTGILNLGALDTGSDEDRPSRSRAADEPEADDDIPF